MSRTLKISVIALCALTLSGCALTNGVLQAAYDNKAEDNCGSSPSYNATTDPTETTGCFNGSYYAPPKPDKKSDKKTEKASFPAPY